MHIVFKGLTSVVSPFSTCYPIGVKRRDTLKKMIIIDIDGTLRDERNGIPLSAITAIRACEEAGHIVCLCTGRSKSMIQYDVMSLGIKNVIAGGGCYIEHDGTILVDQSFDSDKIEQIKAVLATSNAAISMENKHHIFMNQKACDILNDMNQKKNKDCTKKQLQSYIQNEKIRYRNNLYTHQRDPIHKLCLWSTKAVYDQIQMILKDDMILAQEKEDADTHYYEIIQKGCNKADAIQILCDYLHVDQKDTIAFGDGMNDADMLRYCHVGVAMKHSDERLFAYADAVCEDVMQDGIYMELKRRKIIES